MRQLTDESGETLYTQTFDPYGNAYLSAGNPLTDFGYSGEQTDSNGLIFLRARYYDPGSGRFLNMDPSRQEVNPYAYVNGNPVMWVDLSGLSVLNHTVVLEWRQCIGSSTVLNPDKTAECVDLSTMRSVASSMPERRSLGTIISNNRILTHGHGIIGSPSLSSGIGDGRVDLLRIEGVSGYIEVQAQSALFSWKAYQDAGTTILEFPSTINLNSIGDPVRVMPIIPETHIGENIQYIGKPSSCTSHSCLVEQTGTIQSYSQRDGIPIMLTTDAGLYTTPGSSGGGVFLSFREPGGWYSPVLVANHWASPGSLDQKALIPRSIAYSPLSYIAANTCQSRLS